MMPSAHATGLIPTQRGSRARGRSACSGSALIVAVWTVALLGLLVMSFAFDAHLESKVASFARKRRKAEYLALSGITVAQMLLNKQGSVTGNEAPEATATDRWYQPALMLSHGRPIRGLQEPLGEGTIRIDIEPEPGRRNVNKLLDDDWERILLVAGVPEEFWPEMIDSFTDWTDTDGVPHGDGAETDDYYGTLEKPYRARNGLIDTVRELLLVKGFSEAILSGGVLNPEDPKDKQIAVSGIQDMLTTYGDGKVNVNAADVRVLMTLPGVDELVARAIIKERERGTLGADGAAKDSSFTSVGDFMGRVPGLDGSVQNRVTPSSNFFRVTSVGQVGRATRRIWAIVERKGDGLRILRWREEP